MLKLITAISVMFSLSGYAIAQDPNVFKLIRVQNPHGDLTGENWRDYIILQWLPEEGAKTYIIYRALSVSDPWLELARKDDELVRSGQALQDITELARTNSLCYKVEAVNDLGQLVRVYDFVCVPKFRYL
jgi:hypothetical protein